jgi:NAD(P) transhydrogenase subunit beta
MSNITAISYLISSVLFILALRGLSSPTTSRQGNVYGMVGMLLAVITTFLIPTFKHVLNRQRPEVRRCPEENYEEECNCSPRK